MILASAFFVVIPICMLLIARKSLIIEKLFSFIATLSFLMTASIISFAIYEVVVEGTVFMTSIHAIFLNPFLLLSGAFLLLFTMYKLLTDLISF
ncbi:hypothetical protein JOC54_002269 [Alkalihalobacillus xiaoxiensis]|uniref:Transposase n=1 Tax=Shouchella xiaoxiensis TaxID=766895 RepID=A0ABS2STZ2_9BACI|nr:transposase [Shouchella xiaoxiensis]MBM7838999.1 hypothetical protein [Shouchella xiaoxiensis]